MSDEGHLRCSDHAPVTSAYLHSGRAVFPVALMRPTPCAAPLGGFRLARGTRLILALLDGLLQYIDPRLRVKRQRRIRKTLGELLQVRRARCCPSPCPTRSLPSRRLRGWARPVATAAPPRSRSERDSERRSDLRSDLGAGRRLVVQGLDLCPRQLGVESGRIRAEKHLPGPLRPDLLDQFVIGFDISMRGDRPRHRVKSRGRPSNGRPFALVSHDGASLISTTAAKVV
jgi:hypothetical protein